MGVVATPAPGNRVTVVGNGNETEMSAQAWAWCEKAIACQTGGDVPGAVAAFRLAAACDPDEPNIVTCIMMLLDMWTDDPEVIFGERRAFDRHFCAPRLARRRPHANVPDPERRIKVGYLSSDFRAHSAAHLFQPLMLHHDDRRTEVHLYQTGKADDRISAIFRAAGDIWHPVHHLEGTALADRIRSDSIDVLVDLAGYTQGNRVLTLCEKPAPIQITGWGSTMGTGLACQDYLVSDAIATPPGLEHHYREQIIRLPCLIAFQPPPILPPLTMTPPMLRNGYPTFGYFGRTMKLSDQTLWTWAKILNRLPTARLYVKNSECADRRACRRLLDILGAMGVRPDRISFAAQTSWYHHCVSTEQVDVALDSWPENGGATIVDMMLMGVPVVALLGTLAPGRQASSILSVIGLAEPVNTTEAYVERAVQWASDPDFLTETRQTLRDRFLTSPITDGPEYARTWEAEVRRAWRSWCLTG